MNSRPHIEWALNIGDDGEHVSIRAFAEKFNYIDRTSAEEDYQQLIDCNEIIKTRRMQLLRNFSKFKSNAAEAFWTRRSTSIQTSIVTMKAAVDSIHAGYQQSKIEYRNHFAISSGAAGDFQSAEKNTNDDPDKLDNSGGEPSNKSSATTPSALSSPSSIFNVNPLPSAKKRKRPTVDAGSTLTSTKINIEPSMMSRKERFATMEQSQFWKLRSGRTVEEIVFNASLRQKANFKMRSYTIDFDCERTKSLFTKSEWKEMKELDDFQLPTLPESTEKYLRDLRKALVKGQHVALVPVPDEDQYSCELLLRAFLSWKQLYISKPCPFGNKDLSESFWCREAWPIIKVLLADVDGITMIDGEKAGLESGKRKNMGRKVDTEAPAPRKQAGRKVDLVARDTTNNRDWLIVESLKEWDEVSTKFLRELDVTLFKDLHLIASHRLQEQPHNQFRKQARFFSMYSGGRGFKTMEMRTSPFSSYIMLVHMYDSYLLPSIPGTWKQQAQGLAHLLQVRACATATVRMYEVTWNDETEDGNEEEEYNSDGEWLYNYSSNQVFDDTLGSSPMDPTSSDFYSKPLADRK
ncbi:hypothetical protein BGZ47_010785 [Haplosporangium gracile]|nr:hypothetical protein BGZ47_010785 [Haplosporangium gracile]